MSENLHHIDKLFKKAIEEHEEIPSNNIWDQIDKGLDKNKVVSIQRKYYVLKRVAVAVFIFAFAASVFAIYFNSRYNKSSAPTANQAINNNNQQDKINNTSSGTIANSITNQSKGNKETNLPVKSDANSSANSSTFSSTSSNNNTTALSSADKNKISNGPSDQNKLTENLLTHKKQPLEIITKGNTPIANKSKKPIKINSSEQDGPNVTQTHLHEMISSESQVNIFEPSFLKSFERSNIVSASTSPISKMKKQAHLSVTVFGGPQKNINLLKDEDQPFRPGNRDEFRHSEHSMSSVRTGVLFEYPLTSNWSISSGVIYSTSITSIAPKVVFARPDDRGNIKYEFNCSAGYTYIPTKTGSTPLIGDSAKVFNSRSRISYISIPITAGYNLSAGKFILKPSLGLLVNFLSNGKVESEISSNSMNTMNSTNPISGLKSNYLSGEINLTAVYQLNSKIGIMLSPGSQFALSSINKNTSVKTYPGYIGVTGGMRVAF